MQSGYRSIQFSQNTPAVSFTVLICLNDEPVKVKALNKNNSLCFGPFSLMKTEEVLAKPQFVADYKVMSDCLSLQGHFANLAPISPMLIDNE